MSVQTLFDRDTLGMASVLVHVTGPVSGAVMPASTGGGVLLSGVAVAASLAGLGAGSLPASPPVKASAAVAAE